MTQNAITLPIVHDNGTSAKSLKDAREAVYDALVDVAAKMREVAPNGRDYYLEPGRLELAEQQHHRRCKAIHSLMREMEYEMDAIDTLKAGGRPMLFEAELARA